MKSIVLVLISIFQTGALNILVTPVAITMAVKEWAVAENSMAAWME